MKQTAVEWLYERLERMIPRTPLYNMDKEQYFKQAKEMENEQQGYSEEEEKFKECYFIASTKTSSATICKNCGQEKLLHKQFKNK